MKANQFLRNNDDAVSPVIAVILMVAITVVLAATVYVWVSGFGSNSSQPAKSIAFTSGGTLVTGTNVDTDAVANENEDSYKVYIVSAASPGLKYSDITFTLNGATATRTASAAATACDATTTDLATPDAGAPFWVACTSPFSASATAANTKAADALVTAGDHVYIALEGSSMSGQTLRVLDSGANSIITTLTVS